MRTFDNLLENLFAVCFMRVADTKILFGTFHENAKLLEELEFVLHSHAFLWRSSASITNQMPQKEESCGQLWPTLWPVAKVSGGKG